MVVQATKKESNFLITGEPVKLLRQYEMEAIQLADDWGFCEEVIFPTIVEESTYSFYGDDRLNQIVEFENSIGKSYCIIPELRSLILDYQETLWKDKKNFKFYYTSRVASYIDTDRKKINEDYIIGVHVVNPESLMTSYAAVTKWINQCGKAFDSSKGFTVQPNKNRSLDFLYNNTIVGYAKNDVTSVSGLINLSELVKQFE